MYFWCLTKHKENDMKEKMVVKVQKIRLIRPEVGGFGFYIRGGAEHGLGIYVSHVEIGSEALLQGLRTGDQILKVNGISVDQGTHQEIIAIIKDKPSLDLQVRSGGLIPVKDSKSHPVSWKLVKDGVGSKEETDEGIKMDDSPEQKTKLSKTQTLIQESRSRSRSGSTNRSGGRSDSTNRSGVRSESTIRSKVKSESKTRSKEVLEDEEDEELVKISVQGNQGLGCSICKGPPEKPGIFIQSTKAGRLAREVGLRPGDQILACNGVNFDSIQFGDAVYHLKASPELNLVIRKGAGLDLFPSESSGYDSSASSSNTEPARSTGHKTVPSIPPAPSIPGPPPAPTCASVNRDTKDEQSQDKKREQERREQELEQERQELFNGQERLRKEKEALEQERFRLEEEKKNFMNTLGKSGGGDLLQPRFSEENSFTPSRPNPSRAHIPLRPVVSDVSQFSLTGTAGSGTGSDEPDSDTGSTSASSLAAALQSEIRRRAEKTTLPGVAGKSILKKTGDSPPGGKKIPFISEKNDRHDLLIAEFKRAHRKMFQGAPGTEEGEEESIPGGIQDPDNRVQVKPKPPPPPPPTTTAPIQPSPTASSISTFRSESSTSVRSLSTFKPEIRSGSGSGSEGIGSGRLSSGSGEKDVKGGKGPLPRFIPGIPTPDYDSTPDRSPFSHRKLYMRNRAPGKAVQPPTVDGISRAKSLTSLISSPDIKVESRVPLKGRAPIPGPLKPAMSMKDVSGFGSTYSSHSSLRSYDAPSLNFSNLSKSSKQDGKTGADGSEVSSKISHFSRRHRDTEQISMQSFSIDTVRSSVEPKPPATYFEESKPSPLVTVQPYSEGESFNFQTKPCQPHEIQTQPSGDLVSRIASQDYRAANAQSANYSRIKPFPEISSFTRGKEEKDEKRGFHKFSGLKKHAPLPPPILRRI